MGECVIILRIYIQQAFLTYYQHLLGQNHSTTKIHTSIMNCGHKCDDEMAQWLLSPVTGEEIKNAMFSIPDNKSPGPDGFTSKFFKDAWTEIGADVIDVVKDFFINRRLLKQINATLLTLIPKCDRPQTVKHFRPIACCNVVSKTISKLLCSRLAQVLPSLVNQNQSAFVKGRNIQENVLICQDLIRLYERPHASPRCLFKIDLQKVYDTVSWDFVSQLLDHLNFPQDFKVMVMECITTTSYSISVNGETFGFFKGQRVLRQGDPLSPLIFTLCMDYLTRALAYAAKKQDFNYHPLCKELKLSSLMFVDDVLIFSKGDANSMMILLKAFTTFSKASGLCMNSSKSSAYFGGIPEQLKMDVLRVSGFSEGKFRFTYLGFPIQTTRLKRKDCDNLVEKMCSKIHSYGIRKFSYVGRLVILKSVLTTLHSYWASLFVLPKGVIAKIEAVCRNFLWDNSADYRRAPLVA
ncbi:hypothetical protein vseg_018156 [Gypsophila vaccaria]